MWPAACLLHALEASAPAMRHRPLPISACRRHLPFTVAGTSDGRPGIGMGSLYVPRRADSFPADATFGYGDNRTYRYTPPQVCGAGPGGPRVLLPRALNDFPCLIPPCLPCQIALPRPCCPCLPSPVAVNRAAPPHAPLALGCCSLTSQCAEASWSRPTLHPT